VLGSIRKVDPRDDVELARLAQTACLGATLSRLDRECGHLLVFELEGALRAAAYVAIDARHVDARVHLLVIDPTLGAAMREVEDRMLGVARALCEAYGCAAIEIATTSREPVGERRVTSGASLRIAR
jgi:hypothetical protein